MDLLIERLEELSLECLDIDWVQIVWADIFEQFPLLPFEYEQLLQEMEIPKYLDELCKIITVNSDPKTGICNFNWETLIQQGVQHKALVALLAYWLHTSSKNLSDIGSLNLYLRTANFYFTLLLIDGSVAFNVYHETVFCNMLEVLELGKYVSRKSTLKLMSKSRESTSKANPRSNPSLSNTDKSHVLYFLIEILSSLGRVAKERKVKFSDYVLENIIRNVANITRIQIVKTDSAATGSANTFYLVHNAYSCIGQLSCSFYGSPQSILKIIFFHLLPNMLMIEGFGFDANFRDLCVILDEAVIFIHTLLKRTQEAQEDCESIDMFLQQVCSRVPDKADYRQKASNAVVDILYAMPNRACSSFMKWFINFCYSDKSYHRHFAVEMIEKIFERKFTSINKLNVELEDVEGNDVERLIATRMETEHSVLIGILLTRSQDTVTPVRTKAISVLADSIHKFKCTAKIMKKIFSCHEAYLEIMQGSKCLPDLKTMHNCYDNMEYIQLPHPAEILNLVRYSLRDERAFVRKATLSFIENIFKLDEFWMTENDMLQSLSRHCRDPLPAVRKQTIQTLSSLLLHYSNNKVLYELWVQNVLPQVSDPEVKVQEKVLEQFHILLVKNISVFSNSEDGKHEIPWMLIWNILKFQMQKLLISACSTWFKSGNLSSQIIKVILTHIGTEHNVQAWCLIQSISEVTTIKNPTFAYEYYEEKIDHLEPNVTSTVLMAVDILQSCWKNLPRATQEKFKQDVKHRVMTCSLPIELISSSVDIVCTMLEGYKNSDKDSSTGDTSSSSSWLHSLTEKCEEHLKTKCNSSVLDKSEEDYEHLLRCLLTYGNAVQNNRGISDIEFLGKLLLFFFVQKHPETGLKSVRYRKLLATAIISFGKIALVNQVFAKKLIPYLGKYVISTKDSRSKINALYVLTDMCIRYTAAVEPYIPNMSICLKDENPNVREKTLSCFIQLLQEDYIKPRGSLFFNLLSAVCDPDENIQGIIIYFIKESWLPKNPNLMFGHLPESLFYYNGYQGHELYSCTFSSVDKNYFCMSGPENVKLRRNLYRFMLEHLDEFARFKAAQKLVAEILGGVLSGKIKLTDAGEALIRDTLYILSCDEMRITSKTRQQEEELPSTSATEEVHVNNQEKIKKVLLTEATKKNALENIIPVLVNLKLKFQKMKSPLYSDLMQYFLDLTMDYKKEVTDLFASDPNYKKQVSTDLKKFEDEQKKRRKSSVNIDERKNNEQDVSEQTKQKRKSVATSGAVVGDVDNMNNEESVNTNSDNNDSKKQKTNENVEVENLDKNMSDIEKDSDVPNKGRDSDVSNNQSKDKEHDVSNNVLNNDKNQSVVGESEQIMYKVDVNKKDNKIRETTKRKNDETGKINITDNDYQTENVSKRRKKDNMPGETSNVIEEDEEMETSKGTNQTEKSNQLQKNVVILLERYNCMSVNQSGQGSSEKTNEKVIADTSIKGSEQTDNMVTNITSPPKSSSVHSTVTQLTHVERKTINEKNMDNSSLSKQYIDNNINTCNITSPTKRKRDRSNENDHCSVNQQEKTDKKEVNGSDVTVTDSRQSPSKRKSVQSEKNDNALLRKFECGTDTEKTNKKEIDNCSVESTKTSPTERKSGRSQINDSIISQHDVAIESLNEIEMNTSNAISSRTGKRKLVPSEKDNNTSVRNDVEAEKTYESEKDDSSSIIGETDKKSSPTKRKPYHLKKSTLVRQHVHDIYTEITNEKEMDDSSVSSIETNNTQSSPKRKSPRSKKDDTPSRSHGQDGNTEKTSEKEMNDSSVTGIEINNTQSSPKGKSLRSKKDDNPSVSRNEQDVSTGKTNEKEMDGSSFTSNETSNTQCSPKRKSPRSKKDGSPSVNQNEQGIGEGKTNEKEMDDSSVISIETKNTESPSKRKSLRSKKDDSLVSQHDMEREKAYENEMDNESISSSNTDSRLTPTKRKLTKSKKNNSPSVSQHEHDMEREHTYEKEMDNESISSSNTDSRLTPTKRKLSKAKKNDSSSVSHLEHEMEREKAYEDETDKESISSSNADSRLTPTKRKLSKAKKNDSSSVSHLEHEMEREKAYEDETDKESISSSNTDSRLTPAKRKLSKAKKNDSSSVSHLEHEMEREKAYEDETDKESISSSNADSRLTPTKRKLSKAKKNDSSSVSHLEHEMEREKAYEDETDKESISSSNTDSRLTPTKRKLSKAKKNDSSSVSHLEHEMEREKAYEDETDKESISNSNTDSRLTLTKRKLSKAKKNDSPSVSRHRPDMNAEKLNEKVRDDSSFRSKRNETQRPVMRKSTRKKNDSFSVSQHVQDIGTEKTNEDVADSSIVSNETSSTPGSSKRKCSLM